MPLKFYGQFDPPVDQVLYERYFKDKKSGVSIEAGAFDGILENCTYFFNKNLNWRTINIEPLPHIYNKLCKNRKSENDINLNIALSNEIGEDTITVYDLDQYGINNTNASLCHLDKHKKILKSISNGTKTFQVRTNTYKNLIKELNIDELDLFILDVEGLEPKVIDGMIDCDVLPKVFVIEHGHRKVSYFQNYLKCLNKKYRLDYVSFVNSFYVLE